MKARWKLAAVAAVLVFALLAIMVLLPPPAQQESAAENGTARAAEFGRADTYGYMTFDYNGSGTVSLIALSEKPKQTILVLRKDYLNTDFYATFVEQLRVLEQKGFTVMETDAIYSPQNSIIIIPSGAMPLDVLDRMDNLTASNEVIYIGKADLLFSGNLLRSDWQANISNSSKSHLIVIDKSLDEFHNDANLSLLDAIERNSWAEANAANFTYSGSGAKTVFISLDNASWLRMLPLADSTELKALPAQIFGNESIFPWQQAELTIALNYSNGTASYAVEKDSSVVSEGDLERVRKEEAFFIKLGLDSPGDYLVSVSDSSGKLAAKRVHVKDLNISIMRAYGSTYEFSALVDGMPLSDERAVVGLNHSNSTISADVRDGRFSLSANLRQGENIFVVRLFDHATFVPYDNSQEGVLQFYAKYLTAGAFLVLAFYFIMRLARAPVYRITVPEGASLTSPEVRLRARQVLSAMEGIEKRFGWKGVPLHANEIELGIKAFTNGRDVNEGNIEAVMKELEAKGMVAGHLGLYSLPEWGDARRNALRRLVRDQLVESGTDFSESADSFVFGGRRIVFDPKAAAAGAIVVFEDSGTMRAYPASLDAKSRALLEMRLKNNELVFTTIERLAELL